jgi:type III secretion protein T
VDFAALHLPFERFQEYITAMAFAIARMTGLVVIMPAFTRMGLTGLLQGAIAFALGLPLVPLIMAALAGENLTVTLMGALLFKELAIGLMIGLVLGVPIWAAEAAGDMLDLQRGATSSSLFDPSSIGEDSISGTLLAIVMVALFFGSGGLPLTLRTVYESYGIWPAGNAFPTLGPAAGEFFVALLDRVMTMGVMLVAPIIVFMLLSDLLLALVSRSAPNFNIFALSLNLKNLVFTFLLVVYGAFLINYMGSDIGSLLSAGTDLETLAKPPDR